MLGGIRHAYGPAAEVLNEENLHALYGVDLKLLSYEHKGMVHETLVPVLPYASHVKNRALQQQFRNTPDTNLD